MSRAIKLENTFITVFASYTLLHILCYLGLFVDLRPLVKCMLKYRKI